MKAVRLCALLAWFLVKCAAFTVGLMVILKVAVIGVTGDGCVRLVNQDGVIFEARGCGGEEWL